MVETARELIKQPTTKMVHGKEVPISVLPEELPTHFAQVDPQEAEKLGMEEVTRRAIARSK